MRLHVYHRGFVIIVLYAYVLHSALSLYQFFLIPVLSSILSCRPCYDNQFNPCLQYNSIQPCAQSLFYHRIKKPPSSFTLPMSASIQYKAINIIDICSVQQIHPTQLKSPTFIALIRIYHHANVRNNDKYLLY